MTNISKQVLSDDLQLEINRQFTSVISAKNFQTTNKILNSILTKTELTMLAKRVAIILLLDANQSPYQISKMLNVSQTTVGNFVEKYDKGEFDLLLKNCRSKKIASKQVMRVVERILNGGLPTRGRNRWKEAGL